VAALVHKVSKNGIELTLVNTNPSESRSVILQAGAYGEHQFAEATLGEERVSVKSKNLSVVLAPGSGSKLVLGMNLYRNAPNLALPW
jgi:hypothetical protein